MSPISPQLLDRIQARKGVSRVRVYQLIAHKCRQLAVERPVAALAVAADLGINISRKAYATPEDRAALASALRGMPATNSAFPAQEPTIRQVSVARNSGRGQRTPRKGKKSNRVMVVHGRNTELNAAMFSFLRAIGLQPIEWSHAVKKTKKPAPYVGEILDEAFRTAGAVVVLLSPDDEARLKPQFRKQSDPSYEKQLMGQARPNVLFEAGRAFGSHPNNTVLAQAGKLRPFSDTAGIHVVNLSNSTAARKELADRLAAADCPVDLDGTAWMSEGDFEGPLTSRRRSKSA